MPVFKNLWMGFRGLFRRDQVNRELDEELQSYIEQAAEENMRRGMGREDALRAARAAVGSRTAVRDQVHNSGWESPFASVAQDIRYGWRTLRNNPGFTTVAVLTLALGIGVNTGIFTILNAAVLRPLPVAHSDELVSVYQNFRGKFSRSIAGGPGVATWEEYKEYRDNNHVFSGMFVYAPWTEATLASDHPRTVMATLVSCNYFDVLQVGVARGRGFIDSECAAGSAGNVVVLSDELWRSDFGADPQILGKNVRLNRERFVVVGVAPAGFQGIDPIASAFWAPVSAQPVLMRKKELQKVTNLAWLILVGRTKPETSLSQVRADLAVIAHRIDRDYPGRTTTLDVQTAARFDMPEMRMITWGVGGVILFAVGLVLLVACANVASLLLARAAGRRKEIAVRLSLGASRGRVVRQLLTESLLLALIGGTLGSLVSFWSTSALVRYILAHLPAGSPMPITADVTPDVRVVAAACVLSLLTGLVFGLAPALQSTRPDLMLAMKDEGGDPEQRRRRSGWLRSTLVSTQVAFSMILLLSAGLLMRGLYRAQNVDPGFAMANIAEATFDLTGAGYTDARAQEFQRQLAERVGSLPGVDYVAQSAVLPLNHDFYGSNFIVQPGDRDLDMEYNYVTPGYFDLLHIPIVRGRNFTEAEARSGAHVIIVTESTARRLWPGVDPIGQRLRYAKDVMLEVIGVAHDAQVSHLGDVTRPYLYMTPGPDNQLRLSLLAHTNLDYGSLVKGIRASVASLDAELPPGVQKIEDNLEQWRTPSRIVSALSGFLGTLALTLAAIGVYGMVAYGVSRRVREIGIRMALGADAHSVMLLVLRQALLPVGIGAVIGIAGCAAVSAILQDMLFGISPYDPLAFSLVPAFLLAAALVACYVPARKAMRVNPVEALRSC